MYESHWSMKSLVAHSWEGSNWMEEPEKEDAVRRAESEKILPRCRRNSTCPKCGSKPGGSKKKKDMG